MLAQTPLSDERVTPPLQVERARAAWSQDVAAPQRSTRFLWTGLGMAALMLIGFAACVVAPAALDSASPSRYSPHAAVDPVMPLLAKKRQQHRRGRSQPQPGRRRHMPIPFLRHASAEPSHFVPELAGLFVHNTMPAIGLGGVHRPAALREQSALVPSATVENVRTAMVPGSRRATPPVMDQRSPRPAFGNEVDFNKRDVNADFDNIVDSLTAAKFDSQIMMPLNAWFQANPKGIVALPLGPDGSADIDRSKWPLIAGRDGRPIGPGGFTYPRDMTLGSWPRMLKEVYLQRRTIMNLIVLGGGAMPVGSVAGGFVYFFTPAAGTENPWTDPLGLGTQREEKVPDRFEAKDMHGNNVFFDTWLSTNKGLEGIMADTPYLIVTANKKIEHYTINALNTLHGKLNSMAGKERLPASLAVAYVDDAAYTVTVSPRMGTAGLPVGSDPQAWWELLGRRSPGQVAS